MKLRLAVTTDDPEITAFLQGLTVEIPDQNVIDAYLALSVEGDAAKAKACMMRDIEFATVGW